MHEENISASQQEQKTDARFSGEDENREWKRSDQKKTGKRKKEPFCIMSAGSSCERVEV
jgi:hypothetical protein